MDDQAHTPEQLLDQVYGLRAQLAVLEAAHAGYNRMVTALQENGQRLTHALETIADGVLICGQDRRYLFANAAAERFLGQPRSEILRRTYDDTSWHVTKLDGTPVTADEAVISQTLQTGRVIYGAERLLILPNGIRRVISLNTAPLLNAEGDICAAVVSLSDITERKRAEEEVRHARDELENRVRERTAELVAANQKLAAEFAERRHLEEQLRQAAKMEAVGRLAGGVAHDFNNLLTVILGFTDVLLHNPHTDAASAGMLAEVKKAGERAAALTQQLLAFGRKQVRRPQVLNLSAVVAGMEAMVRRLVGEDIAVRIELASDPGPVFADFHQLEQVILNLAANARDAMPQGGKLTFRTCPVERGAINAAGRPCALLEVRDTGSGMDEETQQHLFEPFFTTKAIGKGTGLGLATVYGIITQSGGRIDVESRPGQGAVFRVYLPCVTPGESAAVEIPEQSVAAFGRETILLVEDEKGVRQLASLILRKQGYVVLEAGNGTQALQVAELHAGRIDLLVTDVVMPAMSGDQLAERLRQRGPGLKVLFISGYPGSVLDVHGIQDTGTDFLPKPFAPEELACRVCAVLDAPTRA